MYLSGDARAAGRVRVHGARRACCRELPDDIGERVARSPSTARTRAGSGSDPAILDAREDRRRRRPPPRQHALRLVEPDRRRRVLDRRDRPRPALGARRAAHARDRRGALRRARHRHRPLPVLEHDAEGVPPRGRARRGRRRRARHLPQRLRDGAVREAEAARARARPGAAVRGRPAARLVPRCAPTSTRSAPRSRTPRGSSTTCARPRARRWWR